MPAHRGAHLNAGVSGDVSEVHDFIIIDHRSAGFDVFSLYGGFRINSQAMLSAGIDNLFDKTFAGHVNATNVGLWVT
jgi:outer membrane receptor protein involved in Fe transport